MGTTGIKMLIYLIIAGFLLNCSSKGGEKVNINETTNRSKPLAFPGAEGYGKYTTGGRGGEVLIVSNLNDDGPGSLRHAVKAKGKRIIVFSVSGTIHLLSPLPILSDVTIAGQSAPGDGICIADHPVVVGGDNVIIRYLRFRLGDRYQDKGKVHGSGHDDALTVYKRKNIIIDHCSLSWSTDEVFSVYEGDSTTLQWNLISEPLNYSYHFEKGREDYQHHGYGGIWGGRHFSAHHNLFAHCKGRTPRFQGIRGITEEKADFRNNIIYNWGGLGVYGGEGGTYNIINNYFKYGPSTAENVKYQIASPWDNQPDISFGKWYIDGNYVDGSADITENNWHGINPRGDADISDIRLLREFDAMDMHTQSALEAYGSVLNQVGASLPKRDSHDQRIINDVRNRRGSIIDVQGGYPHGTSYDISKDAWPKLKSMPASKDSDKDGIPDDWEETNGLNINDVGDAADYHLHNQYTNIEVYLNELASVR